MLVQGSCVHPAHHPKERLRSSRHLGRRRRTSRSAPANFGARDLATCHNGRAQIRFVEQERQRSGSGRSARHVDSVAPLTATEKAVSVISEGEGREVPHCLRGLARRALYLVALLAWHM